MDAQKEDHQWIFNWSRVADCNDFPNIEPTCGANILDFNVLPPRASRDKDIKLDLDECNAQICDSNGQFSFYSNGQSIHYRNEGAVLNGDTINYSSKWDLLTWINELEIEEPSGFRGSQATGFIPIPESDNILALYQNYENHELSEIPTGFIELWSSILSPHIDGNWMLSRKDSVVNDRIFKFGALIACRHGNGRDWWLLQFNKDIVYHYIIDPTGINLNHQSSLPFELRGTTGQCKFSPQGDRFALHGSWDLGFGGPNSKTDFMISDFDRCSGNLINPKLLFLPGEDAGLDSGIEFSPDGTKIYISDLTSISQLDLLEDDILGSIIQLKSWHTDSLICYNTIPLFFGQMQLAPDNKIYVGRGLQCFNISVIDFPNKKGLACSFRHNAIELPTYTTGATPTTNTYRLGPLDGSACDTLGFNNNPISRFWYQQDSLDFLSVQLWDVSYFRPEQWQWEMGDGTTSTDRNPTHTYTAPGIYEVCLTVSNENSENTSCQTLNLGVSSTIDSEPSIDVSIFPNPVRDNLRLTLHDYMPQEAIVSLYNTQGQLVLKNKIIGGVNMINVSDLDSGAYVWEVRDKGLLMGTGQVIVVD